MGHPSHAIISFNWCMFSIGKWYRGLLVIRNNDINGVLFIILVIYPIDSGIDKKCSRPKVHKLSVFFYNCFVQQTINIFAQSFPRWKYWIHFLGFRGTNPYVCYSSELNVRTYNIINADLQKDSIFHHFPLINASFIN